MAVEREEYYLNEEADFDARWRNGCLAAGFTEEEIEAGVDWSDPRLKQVDLGSDATGPEFQRARTRIALQTASNELVNEAVLTPWERRRIEESSARYDADIALSQPHNMPSKARKLSLRRRR